MALAAENQRSCQKNASGQATFSIDESKLLRLGLLRELDGTTRNKASAILVIILVVVLILEHNESRPGTRSVSNWPEDLAALTTPSSAVRSLSSAVPELTFFRLMRLYGHRHVRRSLCWLATFSLSHYASDRAPGSGTGTANRTSTTVLCRGCSAAHDPLLGWRAHWSALFPRFIKNRASLSVTVSRFGDARTRASSSISSFAYIADC
ncbi:hypothetical protein BDV10DRAFT_100131 [Aspergillus recurvatus]